MSANICCNAVTCNTAIFCMSVCLLECFSFHVTTYPSVRV
jgi:hypothetical protein